MSLSLEPSVERAPSVPVVPAREVPALTRSRRPRRWLVLLWLSGALVLGIVLATGMGAVRIEPLQVVTILTNRLGFSLSATHTPQQDSVLWLLRLPRVVLACLVGGSLALCGAAMQGLFRNPLADPALLGVSSGAALGAVTSIVLAGRLAWTAPVWALPICAFVGALGAVAAVHFLGRIDGRTHLAGLLLAGIAINAFAGAGVGLATFLANDAQLRSITFWSLGSLGAASWPVCALLTPLVLVPGGVLLRQASLLNSMMLGETEAGHLGFRVEIHKRVILGCGALMVGASVSTVGIVGFVGLVAPHLLRLVLGPDHRLLLPASALAGALLMLAADTVCRTVAIPAEIPVGVATALLGAPFFLWLLWREQRLSV